MPDPLATLRALRQQLATRPDRLSLDAAHNALAADLERGRLARVALSEARVSAQHYYDALRAAGIEPVGAAPAWLRVD